MSAPIKRVNLILSMPHTAADFAGLPLPESDNDSWLYDGEGDLTSAMQERQAEMDAHELKRSVQRNKQVHSSGDAHGLDQPTKDASEPLYDPVELVQGMQAFMNKISSYEGAELPDGECLQFHGTFIMVHTVARLAYFHTNNVGYSTVGAQYLPTHHIHNERST